MKKLTLLLTSLLIVSCNARLTSSATSKTSLNPVSSTLNQLEDDLGSIKMSSTQIDQSISQLFIEKMASNNEKSLDQQKSEQDIRVEAETEALDQIRSQILEVASKNGTPIEELELSLCEDGTVSYDRIKFDDEACTEFDLTAHPINDLGIDTETRTEHLANILNGQESAPTRSEIAICKRNLTGVMTSIDKAINFNSFQVKVNQEMGTSTDLISQKAAETVVLAQIKVELLKINQKHNGTLTNITIEKDIDSADFLTIASLEDNSNSGPVSVPSSTQQETVETITSYILSTEEIECK